RTIVAEKFLWEGRQHWPNDPELLHMSALQALSHEDFDGAEHYLERALHAAQREAATRAGPSSSIVLAAADTKAVVGPSGVSCRPSLTNASNADDAAPVRAPAVVRHQPKDFGNQSETSAQRLQNELDAVRNRNAPFISVANPISERIGDPGINRLFV